MPAWVTPGEFEDVPFWPQRSKGMPKGLVEISETEKAWMAGFIDGEGCLTICKQVRKNRPSPAYRAFISITNTHRGSLRIFEQFYGGAAYSMREQRKDKWDIKWADAFTWYCPVSSSKKLLTDVRPFLRIKSKQAALIVEFIDTKNGFAREARGSGTRGGSARLLDAEIAHRENLKHCVQLLNSKGIISRLAGAA